MGSSGFLFDSFDSKALAFLLYFSSHLLMQPEQQKTPKIWRLAVVLCSSSGGSLYLRVYTAEHDRTYVTQGSVEWLVPIWDPRDALVISHDISG